MLLAKRKRKRVIVFVCTGNTCRSPMAQGLLQKALEENKIGTVEVKTAGVMTIPGLLPTPEAVQVMDSADIDIRRHRSAQLTPDMIRKSDLVLGMTPFHVQFALRMTPDAKDKTFLLKEYTKSDLKNYQITDPMGATLEVYKRVFREIKLAIDRLVEMDVAHAPLDEALKHEKYTPPPPEPKAKAPAKAEAAAPDKKSAAKHKAASGPAAEATKPATQKPKAKSSKKTETKATTAPAKKSATKKPASKTTTAKKPAAKKAPAKKSTAAKAAPASKAKAKKAASGKSGAKKKSAKS